MDSVVNTAILEQLREMLGDDFGLIIDSFHEEGSALMASMENASETSNMRVMKEGAHAMKSMSGNVGAMGLSDLSDQLQIAAANEDAVTVAELWPQVRSLYSAAVEELENRCV